MKAKWKKKLEYCVKLTEENEDPINIYNCRRWSIDWDGIEIFEDGSLDRSFEARIHTATETRRMVSPAMVVVVFEGLVLGSNLMDMLLKIIWMETRVPQLVQRQNITASSHDCKKVFREDNTGVGVVNLLLGLILFVVIIWVKSMSLILSNCLLRAPATMVSFETVMADHDAALIFLFPPLIESSYSSKSAQI
ncbi:hypothetical protein H5410_040969 [Solanum commersonii]|uniref:Uncharacterized protein n=1 Tax=Solanum commersonii TaxID=4109 RepID=A0A9J5XSC4_SOLCO|nr:hypothetical protein H5410_040969 [Solanum commersonii]